MVLVIPKSLVKIYENWDIRGGILLSFSLQVFLVLFAPLRKRSNSIFVGSCIWSAYLLADWAPSFSAGLVFSDSFSDVRNTNASSSKNNLMAFWAPFLLLHFGGPDTITALALADNQLWPRQIPTFFLQVGASIHVFILTLPGNTLWIPTLLIFIAGIIKYTERTRALYFASNQISSTNSANYPSVLGYLPNRVVPYLDEPRDAEIWGEEIEAMKQHSSPPKKLVHLALGMIEVHLELLYEMFYTKALVLHNKMGFRLRFVAFSSIVVALEIFTSLETNGSEKFNKIDVIVTYTLLYGAVCLDVISLLKLMFSEWTTAACFGIRSRLLKFYEANVGQYVLSLRRQRWSKCKEEPYTKFQALSTPLLLRKWCGSIPRHNLIRYCLRHPKNQVLKGAFTALYKFADCFGARELLEMSLYKANSSFLLELWHFIFNELNLIHELPEDYIVSGAVFRNEPQPTEVNDEFMSYFDLLGANEGWHFVKVLIMWHVVTDLCYADKHDAFKGDDERHFSKLLSDYMIYLLIMQPNMLSQVADKNEAQAIFEDTCEHAIGFFKQHKEDFNHQNEEKKEMVACSRLLRESFLGEHKRSTLSEACEMAEKLRQLNDKKWKFIGVAWVRMLAYAAYYTKELSHIERLPQGGELISLVWFWVEIKIENT